MPRVTLYIVQAFVEDEHGVLLPEEPFEAKSEADAKAWGRLLIRSRAGVMAWAKSGDPDTRQWDESLEVLFRGGIVPDE